MLIWQFTSAMDLRDIGVADHPQGEHYSDHPEMLNSLQFFLANADCYQIGEK